MRDLARKYTNGEVTIVWKPELCTHAAFCFRELPKVFDPNTTPWVDPNGATTEQIIQQVKRCPTAALSYFMNSEGETPPIVIPSVTTVEVVSCGPLIVRGEIIIRDKDGKVTTRKHSTSFCRCGMSENKPFCDGSHEKINFKD